MAQERHVRVGGVLLVGLAALALIGGLAGAEQGQPGAQQDDFQAASLGGDADVKAGGGGGRRLGQGEEGISPVVARRREDGDMVALEQGVDLSLGPPDGGGAGDDLGAERDFAAGPGCEHVNGRFVNSGDGSEGTGDQVQLVLNNEFRGRQGPAESFAVLLVAGAVKTFLIVAVNQTEKGSRFAGPRQGRKFVNGGDEEGGQTAVDGFVNSEDRQAVVAGKGAFRVGAEDPQVGGRVDTWNEAEGVAVKLVAAPGTGYASVLPPPVGKKRRSTVSRSRCVGSKMPRRFIRM